MINTINLNLDNFKKNYLREIVFNEIDKLTKRNKAIINLKSYRSVKSFKFELKNNDVRILFLNDKAKTKKAWINSLKKNINKHNDFEVYIYN